MSENLLTQSATSDSRGKPQGLPDKYWDEKRGEVRLESLIADFNNMAARDENLVETNLRGVPESYDKYDLKIPSPYLERDDEVLRRMYDKHFTNDQAQLVYDLANERVIPVLSELTVNFEAQKQIETLTSLGFGGLPICIAKTQYSFSDDPKLLGAPENFTVTVKNVKVSAGAGFIVVLTGDIMTMPGLPKSPAAERIDVDEDGRISGLF